jgi:mercuric ion transport protein
MMQPVQPLSEEQIVSNTESPDGLVADTSKVTLIGGLLAGIGASACCVGPFLLLSMGIGGSWVGNLTAMTPYRPYLIGLTLVFLGLAFRKLYLVPQSCEGDSVCAIPAVLKKQRIIFWIVSIFILLLVTFQYYGPYLLA